MSRILPFAGKVDVTKTVRLEGMKDLEKKLRQIEASVGGRHLLDAVDDGAEILRGAAASLAPRAQGAGTRGSHGADDIVKDELKSTPTRAEVGVGAGRSAWHLMFAEIGTIFVVAQPWLRPALDRTHNDVVDEINDSLRSRVLGVARGR